MGTIIPNMGITSNKLSNALFSKTRQQVLGLLYGHVDQSFHTNEIIRLTHTGTGAVQRELKQLAEVGVLIVKSIGNQKHYAANHSSPLFNELHGIVLKTFGLVDVIRIALEPINSQIHSAFIYGSIAKQEERAGSDIDLMIIADDLNYADLFSLLESTQKQLGRVINPTFYAPADWARKKQANNNFVAQVAQQPKIFVIGSEDEFSKLG